MTAITQKVRKYMMLFEDLIITSTADANPTVREYAEFRIKGFARRLADERDQMIAIQNLNNRIGELTSQLRTMREDFPHLFEDEKARVK